MRLRTTSVAASIASSIALSMPDWVGVSTKREPSWTSMFQSRSPVRPTPLVSETSCSRAASTCEASSTMKAKRPFWLEISPMRIAGSACFNFARTLSSIDSSRWRATCELSASSRMWLPPARSRPRLITGLGRNEGHGALASANSEGSAARAAARVTNQNHSCFQRGKSSIRINPARARIRRVQSLAGFEPVGVRTSEIVALTALTRVLGAISISAYCSSTLITLPTNPPPVTT